MPDHLLVPPHQPPISNQTSSRLPIVVASVFALLCLAIVIFELFIAGDGYFKYQLGERTDQNEYHMPVIERFAEQLPAPDLVSYPSATTPGYHLVLALAWRATESPFLLRMINIIVGGLLVYFVIRIGARWVNPLCACALVLPMACNPYVLGGTTWLTTDNAALLFVVLAVGTALQPATPRSLLASGAWGVCAVLVRQVHLWVAGAPALAGALASAIGVFIPVLGRAADPKNHQWRNLWFGALAFALPVIVVGGFALAWGGLVPAHDEMRTKHGQGWNPAAFATALALVGIYAPFFAPIVWNRIRALRPSDPALWLAGSAGLVFSLVFETSWELKVRDYGWFWRAVVKIIPDILERSPVITIFSIIGSVALLVLTRAALANERRREATILLVMMLGWVGAQSMNSMAWQRYFDPPVLFFLAWFAALACDRAPTRRALAGPILLGVLSLGLFFATFLRDVFFGNLPN